MKFQVFAILDKDAMQFGPLFEAVNESVAMRSALEMRFVGGRDRYSLYMLGEFDRVTGKFVSLVDPYLMAWPEVQ